MTQPLDLTAHGMLALSRESLASLRTALLRASGPAAAVHLQQAGYAGGDATWTALRRWVDERSEIGAEDLDVEAFQQRASEFFQETGWGSIEVGALGDVVATLDSVDWREADPADATDHPCCHLTTGMFAHVFGHIAGTPVAVLEVECRSMGDARCRFLLGSPPVLEQIYGDMGHGLPYQDAVAACA